MIYNKIKENLKNNILIDEYTILDYVNKRIEEEDLEDYILCSSTTDIDESYFDPEYKHLCINTEEIFCENSDKNIKDLLSLLSKKEKKSYFKDFILENPNSVNIYNLYTVNHELNHIIQKKVIVDNDDKLRVNLFSLGTILGFIDDAWFKSFYYKKYHDRFYNEYNAIIQGYCESISLLEAYNLKNIEKDLIKVNKIVSNHILYLYTDIDDKHKYSTPIKNSLKLYKHLLMVSKRHDVEIESEKNIIENIKKEKPKSKIDKLLLGFSINKDTYDYLNKVSSGREKTLNLFKDINY